MFGLTDTPDFYLVFRRSTGVHEDAARVDVCKVLTGRDQAVSAHWNIQEIDDALVVRNAFGDGAAAAHQPDMCGEIAASVDESDPHSHSMNHHAGIELRRDRTHKQKGNKTHATLHGTLLSRCQEPVRRLSPGSSEGSCDNLRRKTREQKLG